MKKIEPFKASGKCKAKTKTGKWCGRTVVHGPRCWTHSQTKDHLRVKPSKLKGAGRGLFTSEQFSKNQIVAKFKGPTVRESTVDSYSSEHQQNCIPRGNGTYVDSSKTNSCFARYANEAPKQKDINAEIVEVRHADSKIPNTPCLEATKPIHKGQEVETDYGAIFPRNYPHWRRQTSNYERSRARRK